MSALSSGLAPLLARRVPFYYGWVTVFMASLAMTATGELRPALDQAEAALAIAPEMEFSPAWNRDRRVPVWISLDLVFEVRQGD